MNFLIYGANGYTGELIAREAVRRGLEPVIAGRSRDRIAALARELQLEYRSFDLKDADLHGIDAVLHCAGPFVHTAAPMVRACIAQKAHYLDITGEIAVFERLLSLDEEAREAGIVILPGVGFDVVPTDTVAAMLADALPGAQELALAFFAPGAALSRGTSLTMVEGIGEGGAIRREGKIVRVPFAYDVREIPYSCGPKVSVTVPWGDVATAWRTTGIPSIRVYTGTGRKAANRMKRLRSLLPLMAVPPLSNLLRFLASRRKGPDAVQRKESRSFIWGEARRGDASATMTMETPEGYEFTVHSALAAMEKVMSGSVPAGAWTPARALGVDFIQRVRGVTVGRVHAES